MKMNSVLKVIKSLKTETVINKLFLFNFNDDFEKYVYEQVHKSEPKDMLLVGMS